MGATPPPAHLPERRACSCEGPKKAHRNLVGLRRTASRSPRSVLSARASSRSFITAIGVGRRDFTVWTGRQRALLPRCDFTSLRSTIVAPNCLKDKRSDHAPSLNYQLGASVWNKLHGFMVVLIQPHYHLPKSGHGHSALAVASPPTALPHHFPPSPHSPHPVLSLRRTDT